MDPEETEITEGCFFFTDFASTTDDPEEIDITEGGCFFTDAAFATDAGLFTDADDIATDAAAVGADGTPPGMSAGSRYANPLDDRVPRE